MGRFQLELIYLYFYFPPSLHLSIHGETVENKDKLILTAIFMYISLCMFMSPNENPPPYSSLPPSLSLFLSLFLSPNFPLSLSLSLSLSICLSLFLLVAQVRILLRQAWGFFLVLPFPEFHFTNTLPFELFSPSM